MTTETTEKQLLFIDKSMAKGLTKVHRKGHRILNELTEQYNQLSIGNITKTHLEAIFANDFSKIETDVWATVNSDLKKFRSQFITDALREETQQRIDEFKEQASQLVENFHNSKFFGANHYPLEVENFTIRAGKVELSPKEMEGLIHRHCAVYIETPEQEEFWQMLREAQKACHACKQFLSENEISTPMFSQHFQTPGFLVENTDGITIDPRQMKF